MMTTDALKPLAAALVLTVCAALAATAQEGRSPAAPVSDVDRAVAAFRAGRHAEALAAARRAADASPTAVRALTTRASIAEFMGEFDEARTFYDKAAALTPDDPGLIYRQASYALRVGEYDRALAQLDRLLALHPRQVRWLFQYAPTRLQAQLLRENPSLEHIVQIKIDILMEKGDLAQARRLAQGYAIVQPGQDYCGQARAVMAGRNREDVFKAFRLATLGQPDAADCIWWYGQWLSDEGYVLLGRVMVIEGSRVTPSAANKESGARYVRIRLGGNRDVPKRAEQLFLIARQRYLRDGDLEGAQRLFDECIRLAPGFARPYNYRALMAAELGDREAAIAWFQKGLKADNDSWRTHRNLGKLLAEMERYPEAEMHLRKTVELFGDDAGGHLALARVLYAEGKYDEFLKEATAAVTFLNAKTQIVDVREFLSKFDRWGPGAALPPAPDPNVIIGWNYD
jgi:tetratricopeptide (TPR) repeat protein